MGRPTLRPPRITLKSANDKPINVRGCYECNFVIDGHHGRGKCYVADTPSLLGLDWIIQHEPLFRRLTEGSISNVSSSTLKALNSSLTTRLKKEFSTVFTPGLGHCTKSKAKLTLKPNAKPVFQKARPVPYAAVQKISTEIDRLVSTQVPMPVDHSEWSAPIVAVQKKNGSIRLCADYSTGLNDALEQHQHPLPTPDDIFTKFNGGRYFSQLDLAEAYLQLEVDVDLKQLLTINTHRGLFRFNRLPFGVKPAPGIFQQCIDALIAGLDGTAAYLDDILVTGRTIDEHNTRLEAMLLRIQDYGFRVRLEKCKFLQTEINYLGFVINEQGRRPDPDKIEAIQKMPAPKDVSQLRASLGLINFYGNFVKDLHNLRAPLDALTKKDVVYTWTPECQSSFDKIKAILSSDLLLTHFDPNLPIIVAADASNYGIGATLSHRFPDGSEKVVYHVSRCLTTAQKNYSQIEKEALALIFAVQKFHRFVHGRHFTLKTDHKPLVAIFGSKKGIPVYSANRLQRWATKLLNYNFAIEYVNTKDFGQVDALSRLIASHSSTPEDYVIANVDVDVTAELIENCRHLPVSVETIRTATRADQVIRKIIDYIKSGNWPAIERNSPFWHYYNRRDTLTTVDGCLLTASRIVIPGSLQRRVLTTLHKAHPGQTRMKMLARSYVYWPTLDTDIEQLVRNCSKCASVAKNPVKGELYSWPKPTSPWIRVHAHFAGLMNGRFYLILVDAYSK
nr:RNA-directed DNA polymerase (reverse transcriptase) domain containing protein [Haemonchus contortus]